MILLMTKQFSKWAYSQNVDEKEFLALKEFSKILFNLSAEAIKIALENGDFIEVKV